MNVKDAEDKNGASDIGCKQALAFNKVWFNERSNVSWSNATK